MLTSNNKSNQAMQVPGTLPAHGLASPAHRELGIQNCDQRPSERLNVGRAMLEPVRKDAHML
jgi:hypothetical protein